MNTRMPNAKDYSRVIVTTMKDEAPYILDWVSYHISIGFTHFVILTNDCSDGTNNICRNLEHIGVVTHKNNKEPYPRGIQKTGWKRAEKLEAIQNAEWLMALDVDEYLYLEQGDGTLEDMFKTMRSPPVAISFTWQTFGNDGIHPIIDQPVYEQFSNSSHPLQAKPYQIRGLKTLYQAKYFDSIGTHRPHEFNQSEIGDLLWVSADGSPINYLFDKPHWLIWDDGTGYGGTLGRVYHYPIRSKDAFLLKIIRGFVNRTGRGVRSETSPLAYWHQFEWDVYPDSKMLARSTRALKVKEKFLRRDKIARLHAQGLDYHHQAVIDAPQKHPEIFEAFQEIMLQPVKNVLAPNDPVLQESAIPILFDPENLRTRSLRSILEPELVIDYYSRFNSLKQ